MRHRTRVATSLKSVLLCGALLSFACAPPPPQTASIPDLASPQDAPIFDAASAASVVFPDAAERSMYRVHSPETADGKRGYTYEFVPAQGKLNEKQFQLVSITWSRRNPATSANSAPTTQGIGGPGGSFTDSTVQTADGGFDIRVTLGTLLPAEIQPPAFDPRAAAERIAAAYNARKIR